MSPGKTYQYGNNQCMPKHSCDNNTSKQAEPKDLTEEILARNPSSSLPGTYRSPRYPSDDRIGRLRDNPHSRHHLGPGDWRPAAGDQGGSAESRRRRSFVRTWSGSDLSGQTAPLIGRSDSGGRQGAAPIRPDGRGAIVTAASGGGTHCWMADPHRRRPN